LGACNPLSTCAKPTWETCKLLTQPSSHVTMLSVKRAMCSVLVDLP
jgi:hypothetical protein